MPERKALPLVIRVPGELVSPGFRLAAAVLLALFLVVLFSAVLLAHSAFVRSEPPPDSVLSDPPPSISIWFTEAVELRMSEIRLLDSEGHQIQTGQLTLVKDDPKSLSVSLPVLPKGVYTVAWHNMSSVDGHATPGSFVFSLGQPLPSASATSQPAAAGASSTGWLRVVEPAVRWLGFLSMLAVLGFLVFELLITRFILAGQAGGGPLQHMGQQMESRTLNLSWLAAGLFLLSALAELVVRSAASHNMTLIQSLNLSMLFDMTRTAWGAVWTWRITFLFGLMGVLGLASLSRRREPLSGGREWQMVALVLAAAVLFTLSLISHGAAQTTIRQAAIFSDFIHLLAAAVWVGGILYLVLVVPPAMRTYRRESAALSSVTREAAGPSRAPPEGVNCPVNHIIFMNRFAALAALSIGILVVSGLFGSWAQVGRFAALTTPYGISLLAKLGLIVPLLLLGGFNLWWIRPRLAHDARALRFLRNTVAVQAVVAVLVVAAAGVMVTLEPARQAAAHAAPQPQILSFHEYVDGIHVTLQVSPGRLGKNEAVLFLQDDSGVPAKVTQASLLFKPVATSLGTEPTSASDAGQGKYVLENVALSIAGDWQVEILVNRPDAFDTRLSFPFKVLSSGAAVAGPVPASDVPSASTGWLLLGAEVVLTGLFLILALWMLRRWDRRNK